MKVTDNYRNLAKTGISNGDETRVNFRSINQACYSLENYAKIKIKKKNRKMSLTDFYVFSQENISLVWRYYACYVHYVWYLLNQLLLSMDHWFLLNIPAILLCNLLI